MLVCVPNPPIDPKATTSEPTPMLIRLVYTIHNVYKQIVLLLIFKLVGIVPNPPRDFHAIGSQNATKIKLPCVFVR